MIDLCSPTGLDSIPSGTFRLGHFCVEMQTDDGWEVVTPGDSRLSEDEQEEVREMLSEFDDLEF